MDYYLVLTATNSLSAQQKKKKNRRGGNIKPQLFVLMMLC